MSEGWPKRIRDLILEGIYAVIAVLIGLLFSSKYHAAWAASLLAIFLILFILLRCFLVYPILRKEHSKDSKIKNLIRSWLANLEKPLIETGVAVIVVSLTEAGQGCSIFISGVVFAVAGLAWPWVTRGILGIMR